MSSSIVTNAVILIADNTDGASGASNVCLQDDDSNVTTIHITGGLTNTTPIGVMKVKYQWITTQDGGHNTYVPIPGVFTSGWTTYMSDKTPANYFISESTYPVEEQDNELVLAAPQPIPYQAASWDSANNKVNYTTESCTDYTVVTSNTTSFEDGKWYVVKDDVTINHRIDDYRRQPCTGQSRDPRTGGDDAHAVQHSEINGKAIQFRWCIMLQTAQIHRHSN